MKRVVINYHLVVIYFKEIYSTCMRCVTYKNVQWTEKTIHRTLRWFQSFHKWYRVCFCKNLSWTHSCMTLVIQWGGINLASWQQISSPLNNLQPCQQFLEMLQAVKDISGMESRRYAGTGTSSRQTRLSLFMSCHFLQWSKGTRTCRH